MATNGNVWENNAEITLFQEYIKIPTVHPNIDYEPCIAFLKKQAIELELQYRTYYPVNEQNPVFIITWEGTDSRMTSIMLNSYMDAESLPLETPQYDHFAAEIDANGNIYGHGTQSTKSIGLLYLAAIRALKKNEAVFKRTFHVVFSPDKNNGGAAGLREFVKSDNFTALKIGFCLDEGASSPVERIPIFNTERCFWRVSMVIPGPPGHSSGLVKNTAVAKLQFMLNRINDWRQRNVDCLDKYPHATLGEVSSINVTHLGGVTNGSMIPTSLTAAVEIYFTPAEDQKKFQDLLERWRLQENGDIELNYEQKCTAVEPTRTDQTNLFWMALQGAMNVLSLKIEKQINPRCTNANYLREAGIPTLGFSALNNTPPLKDNPQEYVSAQTYLNAIEIYMEVLTKLGNASKCYCGYMKPQSCPKD